MSSTTTPPSTTNLATDPYRGLIRVSCIINSIHDYRQLLESILKITKEVMNCDAGSLMLYEEETNDLSWHVALGEKADQLKLMGRLPMGQGVAGWVAQERKSALVADTAHDSRFFRGADTKTGFQTRSIVCVPLLLNEKLVGVLQALNPLHKDFFDAGDLEIFEAYGAMAATAIEKIRWQEAAFQRQKLQQELEIAQEIQSRFLIQQFPKAEKAFQLSFHYQPASQVGGDFYDVQETHDGSYAILVGDVTGKGVPAALLMAQVLSEFRFRAPQENDPAKILSCLNNHLTGQSARGMFATAWCSIVRPEGKNLVTSQSSAGHLAPLQRSSHSVKMLDLPSNLPLGLMSNVEYTSSTLTLNSNDFLCIYTDGITEARNTAGEEYGVERLRNILAPLPSDVSLAKEGLLQSINEFGKGARIRDDVTFLMCAPILP
jgi:phosphoserine phosphatase RsbU/P